MIGTLLVWLLLLGLCCPTPARARDYHNGFDDAQISWKVLYNESLVRLPIHNRTSALRLEGTAAEQIQIECAAGSEAVIFEHELPPNRVIDELEVSLAVRASHPGMQLYLRIVLPRMLDPTTGNPLIKHLYGPRLQETGRWQTLTCRTTNQLIAKEQVRWRAQHLGTLIDTRDLYVDRVYLHMPIARGVSEMIIDDLRMGPLVEIAPQTPTLSEQTVKHVSLRADRLYVDDAPFFPRILPSHGETLDQLKASRANVIYTDGLPADELIEAYRLAGLWTTTTPPCLRDQSGQILPASLALNSRSNQVPEGLLFWTLGTRVGQEDRLDMLRWIEQVQNTQPEHPRPIFADISSGVDMYSKDLDFLGISRHVLQTSITLEECRDYLVRKATIAAPDALRISWIQTDPHAIYSHLRPKASHPVTIEPEQIKLQAFTALASGCRGLGYWKQTPLHKTPVRDDPVQLTSLTASAQPALLERDLAIELVNLELELLEVFLASGDCMGQIPVHLMATSQTPQATSLKPNALGTSPGTTPSGPLVSLATDIQASIIRSPHGLLVLPMWFGKDAQYVPAPLTARDCRMVIHGVSESAIAWELSPTKLNARSVDLKRVTGGMELTLKDLDMTAAILVTSDRHMQSQIERKITQLRAPFAELTLQLAQAKYERTKAIINELSVYTSLVNAYAPLLNSSIPELLKSSQKNLNASQFDAARMDAQKALQSCRFIQYEFWSNSVVNLSQPASSLDALCFQTLPDYWRLSDRLKLKESTQLENLLKSGDFEVPTRMAEEGWERLEEPRSDITLISELASKQGRSGEYGLRLAAFPTEKETYLNVTEPLIRLISPAVDVHAGETVILEGYLKTPTPVSLTENAFRIYDNQAGSVAALRYTDVNSWTAFRLVRQIHQDGPFFAVFDLSGLGDVLLDDIAMKVVPAPSPLETPPAEPASEEIESSKSPLAAPWELLKEGSKALGGRR